MKADEVRIAEAIAALTARLTSWNVDEPHDKARGYVTDMLRNGWRPRAAPVETPPMRPQPATDVERNVAACRAALRSPSTETETEESHE